MLLARHYQEVDALDAFNTFQTKLRGFLEKQRFRTVSSLELAQSKGKDIVMLSAAPRGLFKIDPINKKSFYRDFFGQIHRYRRKRAKTMFI